MSPMPAWRTPSRCDSGQCVEAAAWHASSYCAASECVETATCPCRAVLVRDNTDREGPVLEFPAAAWRAFTTSLKTTQPAG